ncbi:DNA endonuclease RBBP8 [Frankliniella fusca]|uniref:DNA endonuclease RBBP8 n=1 Tax=Frankliniella fusca TaxID=407009 RepID=A0AAE1L8C4_9NEOP|nr:DNA endonuclease RBBP8 [Frankliniella fusca]
MRCSDNFNMSRSHQGANHDIESLWFSLMPRTTSFDRNTEEVILKLSLLLQSTQLLVTELYEKQKNAQDQLQVVTGLKEKSESEKNALLRELHALKSEFHSVEEKARKHQKEAAMAVAKHERLKTKISTEVENRLHKMFNDCLQQNKAATVLDMMTQMCLDNVMTEEACIVEETLPKRSDRVAHLKSSAIGRLNVTGSPDVIPGTPQNPTVKDCHSNSEMKKPKPSAKYEGVESAQSSPDVIGDTPPIQTFERKNHRKGFEKRMRLFKHEEIESDAERKPVVYVKDTQDDDDDLTVQKRPAIRENIIVPETLDPDNYAEKSTKIKNENISPQNNKENKNKSLNILDTKPGKIADLSTDADFPLTPKKSLLQEDNSKSPILGNSGLKVKSSARNSLASVESLSSAKSPRRNRGIKKLRTSLDMTSSLVPRSKTKNTSQRENSLSMEGHSKVSYNVQPNKKISKSKQPTIFESFSKESHIKSKLSLSKRKKDISSRPEFNGGLRSASEHSIEVSNLSEKEQLKIAIENSMRETPVEDTDATLFIPNNSTPKGKYDIPVENNTMKTKETIDMKFDKVKPSENKGVVFQPLFASTAVEDFTQLKPKSHFNSEEAAAIGKPLYSSTVCDENSALNELQKYLDEYNDDDMEEDEDDDDDNDNDMEEEKDGMKGEEAVGTSYDRLPQKRNSPSYAYKGPTVRKKKDRKNLKGFDCSKCVEYYKAAFAGDSEKAKEIACNGCSRHRDRAKNGPRSRTPPGYWGLDFPPTQALRKRQQELPSPEKDDS